MRSSIWNKTIPTWTGMALLLVGVIATISLVRTGILFPIRASQNEQPTNVTFSNVTDTSATLSYTTASATGGTISYGETPSVGTIVYDDRDKNASAAKPYLYHYFTITNLKPDTVYYFTILSGSETYKNNTEPYSVKTGKTISEAPTALGKVQGKILLPTEATREGIVYIKEASSQTLSSFVQPDGSYTVPLTALRTTANDGYSTATENSLLTITVYANNGESTINSTIANAQQLAPVTIEQSYDFTLTDPTPEASPSAITDSQSFPTFNNFKPVTLDPQILTPEKDQSFSDLQPQFTGVAPPNRTVDIVINSTQQIKAKVTTDKNGLWKYRPAKTLEPGQHTIQITARDEAGILRTITQSFTVLALGSQFTEPSVAPPSPTDVTPTVATVTPTTAITPTGITPTSITPTGASVTPTKITPTVVTPTATLTPTATPTVTPTLFVTKAPTLPVQPPPSISPTGSESIVLMFGLAGFAIITGAVLFFFTHAGV